MIKIELIRDGSAIYLISSTGVDKFKIYSFGELPAGLEKAIEKALDLQETVL